MCPQNPGFECMHVIGQNKHAKFAYNTLRILPVTMACVVLCWQTYLGMYSSAFCHIWALNCIGMKKHTLANKTTPKIIGT